VVTGASIATELLVTALKSISGEKKNEGGMNNDKDRNRSIIP